MIHRRNDTDQAGSGAPEDPTPQELAAEQGPEEEAPVELDPEEDRWAELDAGDWRDEGPFDIDEVDLDDDEVERLDLGTVILTPIPGAELRLNIVENTQQILSAMLLKDESALDITLFAAPRTGGLWTETRRRMVAETQAAGGTTKLVEGPFGTELRRVQPVEMPDGQQGYQPSRVWMAQGTRWALRAVLYGQAALSEELEDDAVAPFFDAFRDVVVRRGSTPKPPGEVLVMTIPEQLLAGQPGQPAQPGQPDA